MIPTQVNTNGVISFLVQIWQYTSEPFPLGDSRRLIAPYWADVDTRKGGYVMYRETTESDILQRATLDITAAFPHLPYFRATWVFIATWHNVAYYGSRSSKRNTFQAVLVSNGRHSFAIFNYGDITWTTGTASDGDAETGLGGTPAKVGFNAGDGIRFFCTNSSQTDDIVNVETTSNVNMPGRWVFRIDSTVIQNGGCNTDGPNTISPFFGTMLGGARVSISGPCFPGDNIWCKFGDNDPVPGWLDSNTTAVCISPFLSTTGRIPFLLSMDDGETYEHEAVYTSVDPERLVADLQVTENIDGTMTIEWRPDSVDGNTLNVHLNGFDETTGTWNTVAQLASGIANTGSYTVATADGWIPVAVVKTGAFSVAAEYGQTRVLYGTIGTFLAVGTTATTLCQSWYNEDSQLPDFLEELSRDFPCPRTLNQALGDTGSFQADPACFSESSSSANCYYHPEAHHCVRSIGQTSQGAGQQCCYTADGSLLQDGPGRGTPDRVHTSSTLRHFGADVYPWIVCCKLSRNCNLYFELRPANDGTGYVFPWPAWTFGDPHFITLDGVSYTFNGAGEFLLLDVNNGQFRVQGRMEQLVDDGGSAVSATILTALVMKENSSETVQVQLSEVRTMDVLVDGQLKDFQELTVQEFNGFVVTVETATEASISFNSGIGVAVRAVEDMLSIAVTLPRFARGNTVGLLGKWNGDPADDLTTPDGAVVSANSSTQDIHYQFGLPWMIAEEDSLFTYGPGVSYSSVTDEGFTPTFELPSVDPEFQAAAEDACGSDNQACLFDVLTTRRLSVANVSIRAIEEYTEQVEELLTCDVLDPPDVAGTLVISNYSVGSVATFQCEYGVLATPWERVCQSDGSWSDAPPPGCVFPDGGCSVLHPDFPIDTFAIYDNRCHWFSRDIDKTDYATAEQFCESRGGRLVTIKNSAKQQWIENYITRNVWIGLKDRHTEKSFMWSDGTALSDGDYTNWHKRPKHHKRRDCVIIHRVRKEWAVVNCKKKRNRFICEMENAIV
ncbi:PREDICTED: sushi domain-containing protein 2-like [Branchiostoma belcheri]|uniref:Sushi domain-containing protein 2-like n=1 Tax=Branchiostoma belcheri TaxID=7741 RepID=A0A6P4YCP4_BRABE|nr:PREDICTED: sushi domain-containing protein 2-like [Branchiostoma belcheri]